MNKFERISCHNFIEYNGYAYFSNVFYNGLFKVELKTGKTFFLGNFEDEAYDEFNVHWESFRQGNLLYFFPRRGRHVHIYSLDDQSVSSIEIRKASEDFYRIDEIILDDMNVFFLSLKENAPIKKLNLNTKAVEKMKDISDISKGVKLYQDRSAFSVLSLGKYQIEQAAGFSWKQISDGRWYAFLLMGRHLLCYIPKTQKIESVPLTVVNKVELDMYLKSMQQEGAAHSWLKENKPLSLQAYLHTVIWESGDETNE